jgi:unsaturated rhamnogalacturonyl hydrolase
MHHTIFSQTAVPTPTGISWSQRIANSALSRYDLAQSQWHYKHGLLFKGVYHLWQQTGDGRYGDSLVAYVDNFVQADGRIRTYTLAEYNIDQINPGKLLFPLYRVTGQTAYRQAIELLRDQLRTHPRTHEGGLWHKQIYPYQMWLDGIYMASPFLAEYAVTFDEPAALDDAAFQITTLERHTRDSHTGLLYHGWDESRQQPWADPITGCSPHFWSRAMGWYLMALVDVLERFPPDHPACAEFMAILERLLTAVTPFQEPTTGLWWQVMDQGGRPGNYLEASGTAMVVYAIAKGVRQGNLAAHWLPTADRAFDGLLTHLVTLDEEGRVDLHGICSTAGLGGTPYRDGSFDYYVGEPIITNDLHGVGAFLLAAVELENAHLKD